MVGDGTANVVTAAYGSAVDLNRWYYAVGVHDYNANKLYLYLDGKIVAQADIIGYTAPTRNLGIGATGGYWYGNFPGLIDEVKIYNYALTPTQIKLDYNQGAAVRFGPTTGRP
jgi:hypothetical protein